LLNGCIFPLIFSCLPLTIARINDILSARKELGGGFTENLVALYSGPTHSAQEGIDASVRFLKETMERLEDSIARVMRRWGNEGGQMTRDIEILVENSRCMIAGSLDWS